MARMRALEVQ
jgi:hypothetical protein